MYKTFYKAVAFLKENAGCSQPVSVRRVKLDDLDGKCFRKNNQFFIKINKKLDCNHAIDVLLHEYAHTISWRKEPDDHGPLWGVAYSNIYRLFLEKFLNEEK